MLEIRAVDLVGLAEALSDHTDEHTWWFDPATGQLELGVDGLPPGSRAALDTDRLIPVDPLPANVMRSDFRDFLDGVHDPDALAQLGRAADLGDLGVFAEAVAGYPDLRLRWREFVDERRQRRAVQWLADEGVVPAAQVDRELAERRARATGGDPRPRLDPDETASAAAEALAGVYGSRLCEVVPLGDPAPPGGPRTADVLVVLDRLDSVWTELARMEPVLWQLGARFGAVVTALAVAEDNLRVFRPVRPFPAVEPGATHVEVAEELAAAHALSAAGLPRPAMAHAVAAASLATATALAAGKPTPSGLRAAARGGRTPDRGRAAALPTGPWTHVCLVSAMAALPRPTPARLLRSLAERARAAAQPGAAVPAGEAARALADAEEVVRVLGWPAGRARPA